MKGFFFYFILFAYVLMGLYVTNDDVKKPNPEKLTIQTSLRSLVNFQNLRSAFLFTKLNQTASSFQQRMRRDLNSFTTMEKYPVYHPVVFQVLFKLQNLLLVARNPFESFKIQRYYFPTHSKPIKYNLENYQYSAVPDARDSFKRHSPMCNRMKITSFKRVNQLKSKAAIVLESYQYSAIPDPRDYFELKFEYCLPRKQNAKHLVPKIDSQPLKWSQMITKVQASLKLIRNVFNNIVIQLKVCYRPYFNIKKHEIGKYLSFMLNNHQTLPTSIPKKHVTGFQLKSKSIHLESYQYSAVLDPRNTFTLKFEFCLPQKQTVKYIMHKSKPVLKKKTQMISKVQLLVQSSKHIFKNMIEKAKIHFRSRLNTEKLKIENYESSVVINQSLPMCMPRNGSLLKMHVPGFDLKAKTANLESSLYSRLPDPRDSFKWKIDFSLTRKQMIRSLLAKYNPDPSIVNYSPLSLFKLQVRIFINVSWHLIKNALPERQIQPPLYSNVKKYNLADYQYSAVRTPHAYFKRSFPMCGRWMKKYVMKSKSVPRSRSKSYNIQSYQYSAIPNANNVFKPKFEYCLNKKRNLKFSLNSPSSISK